MGFDAVQWLVLVERELLLFAGAFFLLGAIDEYAIDLAWLWLRLTGRVSTPHRDLNALESTALDGHAALLVPAWEEADVIAATLAHTRRVWPQEALRIYVGCYRNDGATMDAIIRGAGADDRVRLVIVDDDGPTTKAGCLNRLYRAMQMDEARMGEAFAMVILQDAEDIVDPAALPLLSEAIIGRAEADFVQLPVLPVPDPTSRWVSTHYCDEFAEAHGKAMAVCDALSAALPAAGVGCAIARDALARLESEGEGTPGAPFAIESLTEDYEMGLRLKRIGARSRFLRVRGLDRRLVATRAYFPATLTGAIRQKTRWVHGIALQGWDRTGWEGRLAEIWMRLRDRRGPLAALVLASAYLLLIVSGAAFLLDPTGRERAWIDDPLIQGLLIANFIGFAWRAAMRFAFTTREYGWREGVRAVLRIPIANIIAIVAGRRALFAYVRTLSGHKPEWDKTAHRAYPAGWLGEQGRSDPIPPAAIAQAAAIPATP